MWIPYIHDFTLAIWFKLKEGSTIEDTSDTPHDMENIHTIVHLSIPYNGFRIVGILDDTSFCTTATWIETRRRYEFYDDVQRSFYSAHFCSHGLKVQQLLCLMEWLVVPMFEHGE